MKTDIKCCGCKKPIDLNKRYYGSWEGQNMIEAVCEPCYNNGVRTEAQKNYAKKS